jgi:hypothetical protein
MSRRFAGAGLSRRPARSFGGASAAAAATPFSIFGAGLVHEWDASLSTITIATGVSSISDLRGGKNLTQATGANQPAYTAAGLQSYMLGDGADYLQNVAMSLSGDLTMLVVGRMVAQSATHNMMQLGTAIGVIQAVSGVGFRGAIDDATGLDTIVGPAVDTTTTHAFVMRNATAVARKFYVDGGAGTAGVRTQAMDAVTTATLFASGAGTNGANARIYWAGIVTPSPSLANLNLWGAWAASRFGNAWTTAT